MAHRELGVPPAAANAQKAREIARIWAIDGAQHVALDPSLWKDPAAWGIMLADFARHVARAYEGNGLNYENTLDRIRRGFEAEWQHPTK